MLRWWLRLFKGVLLSTPRIYSTVKGCGVSLRIGREQLESQPRNMQGTARSQNQKCGFLPGDNQEGKGVPEGESCNLHVL